jgi:hypothetical protein
MMSFSEMMASLAGGRADVLAVVDGARGKFAAMGSVLVATAVIAALSAGFAAHMALGASLPMAIAIGIGWGLVILAVDRALMAGMASQPTLSRSIAVALPRVVLALILGTVISTPVTLQIFHKETDSEIRTIQREAADAFAASLAADQRFTVIPDLEHPVAEAKSRVTSDGGTDPAVQGKQAAYDAAYAEYARLQGEAQCELNGQCGTRRVGVGQAYEDAKAAAERALEVANAAKRELDAAPAASSAQAAVDLKTSQDELAGLTRTRDGLQAEFDARNADNTGLLIRLEALERMGDDHTLLRWAHWLLWAMFTCIELLPVLVKLLMSNRISSEYDRVQHALDGSAADVFDDQAQAWRDAENTRSRMVADRADTEREIALAALRRTVEVAQDREDREKDQQIAINTRAFDVQTTVVQRYLDVYEQQVVQQAQQRIDEFTRRQAQNGAAPSPHVHPAQGGAAANGGAPVNGGAAPNGHGVNTYLRTAQLPDGTML